MSLFKGSLITFIRKVDDPPGSVAKSGTHLTFILKIDNLHASVIKVIDFLPSILKVRVIMFILKVGNEFYY